MTRLPETPTHILNEAADASEHLCHRSDVLLCRDDGCCRLKLDAVTSSDANMYSFLCAHFNGSHVEAGEPSRGCTTIFKPARPVSLTHKAPA